MYESRHSLVRPARHQDLRACVRLWRDLQDEHEGMEPRLRRSDSAEERWSNDFRVWVRSPAHGVFVAEVEGECVGLVTAHPYWPAAVYEERMEVYVNELFVAPAARGRGLGRELIRAVIHWARGQGVSQVRAGVLECNPEALSFWKRVGAQPFFTTVTVPTNSG